MTDLKEAIDEENKAQTQAPAAAGKDSDDQDVNEEGWMAQ